MLSNGQSANTILLIPKLIAVFPNGNNPNFQNKTLWYQHDEASAHYDANASHSLKEIFPKR